MNGNSINKTLSEKIFDILSERILTDVLKPGDRLLYSAIADELGVSLSPVKEALLYLEQKRLVTVIPRKGVYVSRISDKYVEDFSWVRLTLESLAVDKICESLVLASDIEHLHSINNELKENIFEESIIKCIHQDNLFHAKIISMSKNIALADVVKRFPPVNLSVVAGAKNYIISNGNYVYQTHEEIIDALSRKDAYQAKVLLKRNIIEPLSVMLSHESKDSHGDNIETIAVEKISAI